MILSINITSPGAQGFGDRAESEAITLLKKLPKIPSGSVLFAYFLYHLNTDQSKGSIDA